MGSSRKLFFGAVLGAVINTAIVIGNAFLIGAVIVGLIYQHPSLMQHIVSLATLWLFRAFFTSQFERWSSQQAASLKSELRISVLENQSAIESTPATHLTTLLIKGANSLDIYLARFLPQMFGAVITPIAVIIAIGAMDFLSALVALFTLPIIPLFGALIGRYTNDAVTAKWQSLGTLSKYFEDSLRGIFTLAIFGRHKNQSLRIEEMGDKYTRETMKVLRVSFLSALVLELAATISVALIAVEIGLRLVGSSMEFFPALVVLVLAPEVYFPLRNAASLFHASADGGAALSELTSIKVESQLPSGSQELDRVKALTWESWSSPFGRGELAPAHLKSGDLVVLRGGSGLGKTTFLHSLLRFNPSATIHINGAPIEEFSRESVHKAIGWVPQNPSLISGSIRELFTLVDPSLTDQELITALDQVGLRLTDLSNGLDTVVSGVGEKSGHISGGQRRRISIARALATKPSLLIADEPTADLDPASAQEILSLLARVARNGVIVIAVLHATDQMIDGAQEIAMVER
jgi:ABC-type transport system involved in cytochrome bd biosynthesis fused ATPase/permease subunit